MKHTQTLWTPSGNPSGDQSLCLPCWRIYLGSLYQLFAVQTSSRWFCLTIVVNPTKMSEWVVVDWYLHHWMVSRHNKDVPSVDLKLRISTVKSFTGLTRWVAWANNLHHPLSMGDYGALRGLGILMRSHHWTLQESKSQITTQEINFKQ